mmetsp:Transcript_37721/g.61416  ORF Transcript_37721/g.61416 Transcript_37721/m.61416 type:complete len:466 (-) Transcript_37721:4364-5761(-)
MTKLLLRVNVDLGGGRKGLIEVRQGDEAGEIARAFCKRENIQPALSETLAAEIRRQVAALGKNAGDAVEPRGSDDAESKRKEYYKSLQQRYKKQEPQVAVGGEDKGSAAKPREKKKRITKNQAEALSNRLYKLAMERKQKTEQAYVEAKEEQEQEELKECTFHPQISSLAREIGGGRTRGPGLDEEVRRHWETRQVREQLCRERENAHVERECTFRPQISENSERLASEIRVDEDATKAIHDELFKEAERRRVYREVLENSSQYRFTPDIGTDKLRKKQDESATEFIDRLSTPRYTSHEDNFAGFEEFDNVTGKPLFKPQTGRSPKTRSRPTDVPICDYLFYSRHQYNDIRDRLREEEDRKLREVQKKGAISDASRRIAENIRKNKFRNLWDTLQEVLPMKQGHSEEEAEYFKLRCLVELLPELFLRTVGPDLILDAASSPKEEFVNILMKKAKGIPCTFDLLVT